MSNYHHLTCAERTHIARCLQQGIVPAQIAGELGRHKSTVYRELARNANALHGYHSSAAQHHASGRARACRSRVRIGARLWARARRLLTRMQFAPALIARRLGISCEWVYRWLYSQITAGYDWAKHLRTGRGARRTRRNRALIAGQLAARRARPIAQRPEMANARTQFGHWEADLLLGRQDCQGAVLVVKQRTSGLTLLAKLAARESTTVRRAMLRILKRYGAHLHSLTIDNGSEFAQHAQFARAAQAARCLCAIPTTPGSAARGRARTRTSASTCPKALMWTA
jgi:transposase, IS30 family